MLDHQDAPGGAPHPARPVHRPSAVHVEVHAPSPRDPDWRLSGAGPTPAGRGHLWLTGELADTLLGAAGIVPPAEVEGGHSLAMFVSGDGGGGLILRLVPAHELAAQHEAEDRQTHADLAAAGDLERQRGLDLPTRARRVFVLHDGGPAWADLAPWFEDLATRGITVLTQVAIDPEVPGSLLAALGTARDHVEWCLPDFFLIAVDGRRRGLPARGLADPGFLSELARLPVPVIALADAPGGLVDAVAWRTLAAGEVVGFTEALLARELRLAERARLDAIAALIARTPAAGTVPPAAPVDADVAAADRPA